MSAASAMQRRGRAGRVRPGTCYKMFSRRQASTLEVRHTIAEGVLPAAVACALQWLVVTWRCASPNCSWFCHTALPWSSRCTTVG